PNGKYGRWNTIGIACYCIGILLQLPFIDSKGRKHQLPASITFETYEVPYEGITIQPLKNGDLVLNFGGDWTFQF
ncbi:Rhs family protein, partial [Acinetobacter nosocomialis P020]